MGVYLLIEWPIRGGVLRLSTYTGAQWGWMMLAGTIQAFALQANMIAAQNERSALIQMIGYTSLAYAFLGDTFIFH